MRACSSIHYADQPGAPSYRGLCRETHMHSCMQGWGSMDGVWDGSFLEWVGRSQLYSADLLSPDATKDLEQWMQCAAPADKRHMMALLRDLHATVTPTGYDAPTLFCTFVLAAATQAV